MDKLKGARIRLDADTAACRRFEQEKIMQAIKVKHLFTQINDVDSVEKLKIGIVYRTYGEKVYHFINYSDIK